MNTSLLASFKYSIIEEIRRGDARLNLEGADLRGADLPNANLEKRILRCSDLKNAYLDGTDLSYADLSASNLNGCSLSQANLENAKLIFSELQDANFGGANIKGTDFRGANLTRTYLGNVYTKEFPFHDEIEIKLKYNSKTLESLLREDTLENANLSEDIIDDLLIIAKDISRDKKVSTGKTDKRIEWLSRYSEKYKKS